MADSFVFEEWAEKTGLIAATIKKLEKADCNNYLGIKQLKLQDVMELTLSIGQRNLLLAAISDLNKPEKPKDNTELSGDGATGEAENQNVGQEGQGPTQMLENAASSPVTPLAGADPRTILTMKSNSCKAVHITQFLPEQTKTRLRDRKKKYVLGSGEAGESVMLLKDNKHPYSGITIGEWGAANCRLMAHLLKSGYLKTEDVDYYLAYTTQIYEWYETYLWEAILDFDHSYRERQAEHQFKWGVIPPNMQINLQGQPRPKPANNNQRSSFANKSRQANSKTDGKTTQECRLFKTNKGNCPFGDACKFAHTPSSAQKDDE